MKNLLFVSLLLIGGCGGGNTTRNITDQTPFFAGRFVYFADAAVITDCATGVRLPVSMTGAFISAQEAYAALEPAMGETIFMEFRGRIVEQPAMEGDGTERAFVIDSLIGFDRGRDCDREWILSGIYDSNTDGRRVLRLSPDYTFTHTRYDTRTDEAETVWTGRWWRSADLELVLETETPEPDVATFQIIAAEESLTRNDGGDPLIFRKVYL